MSNTCKADVDCGTNATCNVGVCYAKSGVIDEVLLEVVPDANSSKGGLTFLDMEAGLSQGDRSRSVELPEQTQFVTQVIANGIDLQSAGCKDYISAGAQTIQARIEFSRVGAIGGVPILGLSSVPLTVETTMNSGSWTAMMSLLPGSYDIYVQPSMSDPNCKVAPRILRGIDIPQVDPSIPPATLELPAPATLSGKVQRTSKNPGDLTSLEGWTVDIVEPQEGRVISTAAKLGPTLAPATMTNFFITYQRPTASPTHTSSQGSSPSAGPLVRISPPTGMSETAPIVYWDLAAADLAGDGHCNLDMSGVPSTSTLIDVSGQIQGNRDATQGDTRPVRANLQFSSVSLDGADGLTAAFNRTVSTDDTGHYATQLFPGKYRVVILPAANAGADLVPPPQLGDPQPMGAAAQPWAIQEEQWTITPNPLVLNAVLRQKRAITGNVFAGASTDPGAPGATLNAVPAIMPSQVGTLKGVLAQVPVLPQNASITVGHDGTFSLPLDPGDFDISVRTPESSNFSWWVWPTAHIALPDASSTTTHLEPHLPFPVPLEGQIKVRDMLGTALCKDGVSTCTLLRGAAVRAYAKGPTGAGVTKVGDTRTDDSGNFRLRLPPNFGGP